MRKGGDDEAVLQSRIHPFYGLILLHNFIFSCVYLCTYLYVFQSKCKEGDGAVLLSRIHPFDGLILLYNFIFSCTYLYVFHILTCNVCAGRVMKQCC